MTINITEDEWQRNGFYAALSKGREGYLYYDYFFYEDEAELRRQLNHIGDELKEIIQQDGISPRPLFDRYIKRRYYYLVPEIEYQFLIQREEMAERFRERNGIRKDSKENKILQCIAAHLDALVGTAFEVCKEELLEMGAVYGDLIIRQIGGIWYEYEAWRMKQIHAGIYDVPVIDRIFPQNDRKDRQGRSGDSIYLYRRPESILYSDGRSAQMEYTPLRQLAKVKDWLGETKIERDRCGNPVSITDHNGRTVRYEWGSMGQREGIIYPDGTKISWKYDSLLRPVQMDRTAAGRDPLWTQYQYDGQGRLSEKRTSGGYTTRWQYDETGLLGELSHTDASGILDRFQYAYDAAGNKTAIRKERRGFPEESGSYQYTYDGLHRLTGVERDGKPLRSYQYDTFGNRTVMEDSVKESRGKP